MKSFFNIHDHSTKIPILRNQFKFFQYITLSILLVFTSFNCKSNDSKLGDTKEQEVKVSEYKKLLVQQSDEVHYYELPDTTSIENPENLLTFSLPVTNPLHIEQFRRLTTSDFLKYSNKPPRGCLPSYNSALVFKKGSNKEIILFSYNCGLLYMSYEKLYIDVSDSRMNIEESFRSIRSGR